MLHFATKNRYSDYRNVLLIVTRILYKDEASHGGMQVYGDKH
jgi:hypothetical protein